MRELKENGKDLGKPEYKKKRKSSGNVARGGGGTPCH